MLPALVRSSRPLLLVAALGAPLGLSACTAQNSTQGGGSFTGTKAQVKDVITKLSELADDRKSADICKDLFTEQLAASFAKVGGGQCAAAVDRAVRNADYTRLIVDAIDLNGTEDKATTAVARIKVQKDGPERTIRLVHSNVKAPWLIDGFEDAKSTTTQAGTTPASTTPRATATATPKP